MGPPRPSPVHTDWGQKPALTAGDPVHHPQGTCQPGKASVETQPGEQLPAPLPQPWIPDRSLTTKGGAQDRDHPVSWQEAAT